MPAKLSDEAQDCINNWACSDATTTLQKLSSAILCRN